MDLVGEFTIPADVEELTMKMKTKEAISCEPALGKSPAGCLQIASWWTWNDAYRRTWGGLVSKGVCPSSGYSGLRVRWWCVRILRKRTSMNERWLLVKFDLSQSFEKCTFVRRSL